MERHSSQKLTFRRLWSEPLGEDWCTSSRPGDHTTSLLRHLGEDIHPEIQESQYNTPWDSRGGSVGAHNELGWNDGKGPTYSEDRANELLQTRYQNLASGLRITVQALASSEKFQGTVETLRASGWLDWHILTAIFNIVMNHRFPINRFDVPSEEASERDEGGGVPP